MKCKVENTSQLEVHDEGTVTAWRELFGQCQLGVYDEGTVAPWRASFGQCHIMKCIVWVVSALSAGMGRVSVWSVLSVVAFSLNFEKNDRPRSILLIYSNVNAQNKCNCPTTFNPPGY